MSTMTLHSAFRCLAVVYWLLALFQTTPLLATAPCPTGLQINVVHNCFIWPDQDWELLIRSQLDHLNKVGLPECAIIHVALSVPAIHGNATYEDLEGLLNSGRRLVHSILPSMHSGRRTGTIISQVHENSYEYPGIHLLWQLAQEMGNSQDSIFLYFHTKGMVHHGRQTSRHAGEADMFERTIAPWRRIVKIFQGNDTVTRIGVFPAPEGWVWINFWWARTSYILSLSEPVRTDRRHYYEQWLGRLYDGTTEQNEQPGRFEDCRTCYSLSEGCGGYGVVYTAQEVGKCPKGYSSSVSERL